VSCVVRKERIQQFIRCVEAVAGLGAQTVDRDAPLPAPLELTPLRADIAAIAPGWREKGIVPGSDEALSN